MELSASNLLEKRLNTLLEKRVGIKKDPGIALIWVGEDEQTGKFIRAKQKMAQMLSCQFSLHHFPAITSRQLKALIASLNRKKEVHGIVLQLPLPKEVDTEIYIKQLAPEKDIDGLNSNSLYEAPTSSGIVALLEEHVINPNKYRTIIIGNGRLVGKPLANLFHKNNWPFAQVTSNASDQATEIVKYNLVISCAGVPNLIVPSMVTKDTVLVDATGIDADVSLLEPLVKAITPKKGAIGPLTVSFLFENLLKAASQEKQKI